jgi:lysophospholipase L1-like esterase
MATLGWIVRAVVPGLRQVHAQVARYAKAWDEANGTALAAEGPLWVVLGDSTAQGIGAPAWDQGYVGQLRDALEKGSGRAWRVVNLSKSGARAADVVATQLPRLQALDTPPDLVTCAIGANDMVRRTPPPALEASLRQILDGLPPGAVVANIPQGLHPGRTAAANSFLAREAGARGLTVADVWTHTAPPWHGKLAADRFHPGALGYADWAAAFAEALGPTLRGPSDARD